MYKTNVLCKTILFILVFSLLIALSGCGSSNSVQDYSGKTTMSEVEKRIGEPRYKEDDEEDYYSWMIYNPGTLFCGINCSELEFYFTLDKKTLTEAYFEAVYEKTNADAVDTLIEDLTKKHGTPSITKETGSSGMRYTKYGWSKIDL